MAALLFQGLYMDPTKVPSPLIDHPAPQFRLPELADPTRTVATEDLKKQVSLLNVWATWCVSCRHEHPLLMQLARQVPIFGLDYKDERPDARAWLQRFGNPSVANAFDADGRVGIDWGVYGTPETFIIDQAGQIRYKHIGPITAQDAQEIILPWVQKLRAEAIARRE
jgi:cytochrome c biogenesis protein CcmG/thiol:disulfide interchange protein DsbE